MQKINTLRSEWDYVCGTSEEKRGCTAGVRDAGDSSGLTKEDFRQRANEHIQARRTEDERCRRLPEAHAFLSLEEVLAVRLYSGPCYQPINEFLRSVAKVEGAAREALAAHPAFTFAATCHHLVCAIRKLAAVSELLFPAWRYRVVVPFSMS